MLTALKYVMAHLVKCADWEVEKDAVVGRYTSQDDSLTFVISCQDASNNSLLVYIFHNGEWRHGFYYDGLGDATLYEIADDLLSYIPEE